MSETAPAPPVASTPPEKASAGKKAKKPTKAAAAAKKKPAGPSVSELIVQAVSTSKERSGVSLAALKKALAAGGYDVEKNNSRIKLGLKSLVSKGTLVQTKGTGASGSFKLNKKAASVEAKSSNAKVVAKVKAVGAKKPQKASVATATTKKSPKTPKKAKKPAVAKKSSKSPKKPKIVKTKKVAKSPAKAKAVKPKAAKAKVTKPKTAAKPKKAAVKFWLEASSVTKRLFSEPPTNFTKRALACMCSDLPMWSEPLHQF